MSKKIEQIDQYRVLNLINQGTSGEVYQVDNAGQKFALKLLKKSEGAATLVRFRRESATLARLNSNHLVKIFSLGEYESTPYLVMEYLEGDSIEARIKKDGPVAEDAAFQIVKSVAHGLQELHRHGLVHRDVKPANVLFAKDGTVKLIDLGLVDDLEQVRLEKALVGTPMYCAPEQSKVLKRDVDFRSDLYSLGVIFFEMVTGSPPINGTLSEILQKHASTVPPDVREINSQLSAATGLIIKKLLSKDPDDRYQTAIGLINDLDRFAEINRLVAAQSEPLLGKDDHFAVNNSVIFIEKTKETKLLRDAWNETLNGEAGVTIISGPSGSGKTRICQEFFRAPLTNRGHNDFLILRGKCQLFDKNMPFGALKEALEAWIEGLFQADKEFQNQEIQKILKAGAGCENSLRRFSRAFQRIFKNITETEKQDVNAEGEREVFLKDISNFFFQLSKQWHGLVLFIDDLQWLDDSSLQLIEALFNIGSKNVFFLLATARDDQESKENLEKISLRLRDYIRSEIKVQPFSRDQLSDLVRGFLGGKEIKESIIDQLMQRATGSPLVAMEYLRAAIEQGLIFFKENKWEIIAEGFNSLALSENIYSLIVRRSERLSAPAKKFLQYAALWGGQFYPLDISTVAGLETVDLENVIRSSEDIGLIERQGATRWRFVHDKVQESFVGAVKAEDVPRMCDEVADFYEMKKNKSSEEIFSLARIRTKGEIALNFKKVISANITAGNLAIDNFAFSEAKVMFQTAYDLTKIYEKERKYEKEIAPKLAICATILGQWNLAKEASDLNISLSKTHEERQYSLMLKVWTLKNRGDYTAGFKFFEAASKECGEPYPIYLHLKLIKTVMLWLGTTVFDILSPVLRKKRNFTKIQSEYITRKADLYVDAHWCAEFNGWRLDFVYIALKILHLGLTTRRPRELALGYAWIGHVYACYGAGPLARIYFKKAQQIYDSTNDKFLVAICKQKEMDGMHNAGLLPNYEDGHRQILTPEHEKYLPPTQAGFSNAYRVWELNFRGLHKEAMEAYSEGMNAIKSGKTVLSDTWINTWMALNYLQLAATGQQKQARDAKLVSMRTNFKNRYIVNTSRISLNIELTVRRLVEDLDTDLEELLSAFLGGDNLIIYTQLSAANAAQALYNNLNLLESCTDYGKRLALRSEFNRILRRINWRCFTSLNRANIYLLKGRYYRIIGLYSIASHFLREAEKLAGLAHSWRTLFEVQRERARLSKNSRASTLLSVYVRSALELALSHGWAPIVKRLQTEYEDIVNPLLMARNSEALANTSDGYMKTVAGSYMSSKKNTIQRSSQLTRQSQRTISANATHSIGSGVDEIRFVDVLFEVTHAFVESTDPNIQSRAVLAQIVKLFAAERGVIFIKDENTGELKVLAGKNASGDELDKLTGFSSTVVEKVFKSGNPTVVTGTEEGEALGSESAVLYNLRSIMATPLKVREDVIGVVYLDSSLAKGLFTQEDIQVFSTLSNHVSVAFELSRMARVELEKLNLRRELDIQTAILSESKKVEILVDNMRQALFSIDASGNIVQPVSKFTTSVFGLDITGRNITDTLYSQQNIEAGSQSNLKTVLATTFGEDELQWSLAEDNLPRKVQYKTPTKQDLKTLKVAPAPIWSDQEKLEKILFIVEDVTEFETLERRFSEQSKQAKVIEEILDLDRNDLDSFIAQGLQTLIGLKDLLLRDLSTNSTNESMRSLHTLKGNSRLFGLKMLAEKIHETETLFSSKRGEAGFNKESQDFLLDEINNLSKTIESYNEVLRKLIRSKGVSTNSSNVSQFALNYLKECLFPIYSKLSADEVKKLNYSIDQFSYKSVAYVASAYQAMVKDIASQLKKEIYFEVTGEAFVSEEQLMSVQECLLHLVRNSVDHGIELPEERIRNNKTSSGKISISISEDQNQIVIVLSDDGRGIDADTIWKKALKMGIAKAKSGESISEREKLEVIFAPGFSSKDEVSEISGRGVGLDVVKNTVRNLGGEISIQTVLGRSTAFNIKIPKADSKRASLAIAS